MSAAGNKPLLTIAIPTYNGGKTIRNMLNLLLPQITEEVELLISDNCSIDNTQEIIAEYSEQYHFIRYIRNDVNRGPDANILQCFYLAQGDYVWHVSDDDIVMEGAVAHVLAFLHKYRNVGLIHVETVDFRGHFENVDHCQFHKPVLPADICTTNKKTFMKYAGYYWGFMTSFITNTERFRQINDPEQYMGTYWLQSYIHALCAAGSQTRVGVIKGPCVGAGIYVNTPNFDSTLVNGENYKKLICFMSEKAGFDRKQLETMYMARFCHLLRHDIVKEKARGVYRIDRKRMFRLTKGSLLAWLTVYPLLFLPSGLCRSALYLYRRFRKMNGQIEVNRPE